MISFSALKNVPLNFIPATSVNVDLLLQVTADTTTTVNQVDIERRQHDTYDINLILSPDLSSEFRADLRDWSNFVFSVNSSSRPLRQTSVFSSVGSFLTDGADGHIVFSVTAEQAANDGYLYYGIEGTTPEGKILTLVEGRYKVLRDR